jgi:U-box domain
MQEVMGRAVLCISDGHSYEQRAISEWLQTHDTSPVTGQLLATKDLLPNHALRQLIEATCRQ